MIGGTNINLSPPYSPDFEPRIPLLRSPTRYALTFVLVRRHERIARWYAIITVHHQECPSQAVRIKGALP